MLPLVFTSGVKEQEMQLKINKTTAEVVIFVVLVELFFYLF